MSPIEYIAEGIRTGNWDIVCEGYERLTGETLSVPSAKAFIAKLTIQDAEAALRQVADMLSNVLELQQTPTTKPPKALKKKVSRKKTSKKSKSVNKDEEGSPPDIDSRRKTAVQKQTDGVRFITNNPDPIEIEKNKILAEKTKTIQVKRPQINSYDVECSECDSMFQSNRPGGEMGQKCKKCLMGTKSRFV
jgi:hypothetical protein